jgi:lysophospholipase L1-like esterase
MGVTKIIFRRLILKLEGLKVNFLGDSITEGVGLKEETKTETVYHALLTKECGFKVARNYGISGTRFAHQLLGGDKTELDYVDKNAFSIRYKDMDDDADLVVVFGGTNDYGHGNAPIGDFFDRTPETFYGACHYLFRGLIRKYLGKQIVIMTPLHRTGELSQVGDGRKARPTLSLRGYVDIIREVAEYYSLPVIDLYRESGLQPELEEIQTTYIPDGLHPNEAGHIVMARKIKAALEAL